MWKSASFIVGAIDLLLAIIAGLAAVATALFLPGAREELSTEPEDFWLVLFLMLLSLFAAVSFTLAGWGLVRRHRLKAAAPASWLGCVVFSAVAVLGIAHGEPGSAELAWSSIPALLLLVSAVLLRVGQLES
ncbi:MAG TPA: hypothetical protein VIL18_07210 [Longimicrobiales bacterium]